MSDPQQPSTPSRTPSRKPLVAAGIAFVVVVALGTVWYIMRGRGEQAASEPVTPPPVAPAPLPQEAPQTPLPPLPALDQSDPHVREQLGRLSSDAEFQRWLGTEGIIRRIAAATSNVAEGESPRAVLAFLAPQGPFQVVERNGQTFIAPESFARYDAVARVFTSLDTQATAGAYKALKPLLDQAFAEIGRPGQRFDATLARAIQRLLDTPVPEGELEVVATPSVNYAYAAPELEQLSAAQKHLLRMGPANARALQAKLRELREAMGLPPAGR